MLIAVAPNGAALQSRSESSASPTNDADEEGERSARSSRRTPEPDRARAQELAWGAGAFVVFAVLSGWCCTRA